jgi:alkylation response protein AidB-like acyl-CoA dehydrogenase
MDFSLNDHQKLIRDTVRQFVENEVRPGVRQCDRKGRFPTLEDRRHPAETLITFLAGCLTENC